MFSATLAFQVWNPHLIKDILMFEAVQKCTARWIHSKWNSNRFTWSKTTDSCLQELHWPSLDSRRNYLHIGFLGVWPFISEVYVLYYLILFALSSLLYI